MGKKVLKRGLTVLKTDAPYTADKLYELKSKIFNEALTYLGIVNVNENKRERMITDEVVRSMGGAMMMRESALTARKQACEQINDMFGLNVSVEFKDGGVNNVDLYGGGTQDMSVNRRNRTKFKCLMMWSDLLGLRTLKYLRVIFLFLTKVTRKFYCLKSYAIITPVK